MDSLQEFKYDQMIALLKDLKQKPKFSTTVKIITRDSYHREALNPAIQLEPNKTYKAALTSFSTYNSLKNIYKDKNDKFKYSKDKGATWNTITLAPGSYEINSIDKEIKRQIGIPLKDDKQLSLGVETTVNRISLTLDDYHQVDFNITHSLSDLLGFQKKKYIKGYHIGENLPKITDINSIVVHCNIVEGGYLNGRATNALYSFPSHKVLIGYKIIQEPRVLTFFPISQSTIESITIQFTDENLNPIDFSHGEIITDILIQES